MAISLVTSGNQNVASPFNSHLVGDLIIVAVRNNGTAVPVPPAPAGAVPNWSVIESVSASAFAWTVAAAIATRIDHQLGAWTNGPTAVYTILRAAAGKIPAIVNPISVRNSESFTSIFIWPGFTATKKDSTSRGVLFGMHSQNNGSFSNNAGWRPAEFGAPRSVDQATATLASMAVHVSTANLTANFAGFNCADIAPTTFKQRSMGFEVVEASPVTSMVMVV